MVDEIIEATDVAVTQMTDEALDKDLVDAQTEEVETESEESSQETEETVKESEEESTEETVETETETETETEEDITSEESTEEADQESTTTETETEEAETETETETESEPDLEALKAENVKLKEQRDGMSKIVRRQGTNISELKNANQRIADADVKLKKADAEGGDTANGDPLTEAQTDAIFEKKLAQSKYEELQQEEVVLEEKKLLMNAVPELSDTAFKEEMIVVAKELGVGDQYLDSFKMDPHSIDPGSVMVIAERVRASREKKVLDDRLTKLETENASLKKNGNDAMVKKINAAAKANPKISAATGGGKQTSTARSDSQISTMSDEALDLELAEGNEA